MRSVAFDVRNVLRVNWSENSKMLGPLPWPADGGGTPVTTNDRFVLTGLGFPISVVTIGTRSVPVVSSGDPRMGTFLDVGQFSVPNQGSICNQIVPDWITGDINISAYVYASRAATAVIGFADLDSCYGVATPWQSAPIAIPAATWTRIDESGPADIGDDPLNVNAGVFFIDVTPVVGPPLASDVTIATASQVTAEAPLLTYIDADLTDQWRDVERASAPWPQTGIITSTANRGESIRFEVSTTVAETYPTSVR
jgi:hypothetical protein